MRFLFSILILFCLSLFCKAQTQTMLFEKWWGTNDGCIIYYADELPNGDYILIGGRKSTLYPPGIGAWDHYVCRMDFRGNIVWEKEIGFPYAQDYAGGVVKTSCGTYLLVGSTLGDTLPGYRNISVKNIDSDGNVLFERYYTSGFFNDGGRVIETNDSCFVMLCYLGIPSTFNQAPGMIKIDRNGNEIWRHRQDSLEGVPYYINQTSDSGFIVIGRLTAYSNCYYAKYNPYGDMEWIKYPFGLADTIPNYPSALRANQNGTFDIYYGTNYTIPSSNPTVYGLFKHYDQQGNCLSTSINYQQIAVLSLNNPNDLVWGASTNNNLYLMGSDSIFRREVGLEGWDTSHKYISSYIKTSDGGYLGVGQYTYDNQNVEPQFYLVKFGDSRYKPDDFSESVNAFPNPSADGNVTLTFDMLKDDNVQVDIFSSEGKLIYSNSIFCPSNSHTELPVQLDEISTKGGMYILQARTSESVIRKKLVVMRQN